MPKAWHTPPRPLNLPALMTHCYIENLDNPYGT
jgi:hypothetical protein